MARPSHRDGDRADRPSPRRAGAPTWHGRAGGLPV